MDLGLLVTFGTLSKRGFYRRWYVNSDWVTIDIDTLPLTGIRPAPRLVRLLRVSLDRLTRSLLLVSVRLLPDALAATGFLA